ncbi:MAG: glutaredoxin domain-containing protein [Patescibacteria group bacterium]|nr:glutathione S-transferase N-terminal domain-containing protein [Patescibacteria group bacterium]MBU1877077.1 glutathione S-transferase N-terminal domain-containing protein [Patescibacteria group bacterium]
MKNTVKVFSSPFCVYCSVLKQFLTEHNIGFEEFDVSQDAKARDEMIEKSKQMAIPVVEINGEIIIGFDKNKIVELLGMKE